MGYSVTRGRVFADPVQELKSAIHYNLQFLKYRETFPIIEMVADTTRIFIEACEGRSAKVVEGQMEKYPNALLERIHLARTVAARHFADECRLSYAPEKVTVGFCPASSNRERQVVLWATVKEYPWPFKFSTYFADAVKDILGDKADVFTTWSPGEAVSDPKKGY